LMKFKVGKTAVSLATAILACGLLVVSAAAGGKAETFKGQVSDTMCGAKHAMPDNAACTRACVKKGSNYALVVGDKVYTLNTSDKAALEQLDKLAGQQAEVKGTADGDAISVSSVKPAA